MGEAEGERIIEGSGYQRRGGEGEDVHRAAAEEEMEEGEEHGMWLEKVRKVGFHFDGFFLPGGNGSGCTSR